MVAPRPHRIQIGFELRVVERGRDLLPSQLPVEMRVEHLGHHHDDRQRIHAGPWLRAIHQQTKLRRKRILVLRDEEIHSARVIIQSCAIVCVQVGVHALCRPAKLQRPLRLVMPHQPGAEDLCQVAIRVAPECVHLPQAVLRGHVALREKQVVLRGSFNVRHAVRVALHSDRRGKAGKMQVAIQHRQCALLRRAQPQHANAGGHRQQHNQNAGGPQKNAPPAAFAVASERRGRVFRRWIWSVKGGHRSITEYR